MLHEIDQGEICLIFCLTFTSCAGIIYSVRRLEKSQMVGLCLKDASVSPLMHMYSTLRGKCYFSKVESQLCFIYVSTVLDIPIKFIEKDIHTC